MASLLGLLFGYVKEKASIPVYESSMLIQQNYNTGKSIYNTINYYNGLISDKDFISLSQELSIDTTIVSSIVSFDIAASVSLSQKTQQFDKFAKGIDSLLRVETSLDDYLETVDESIYTTQQLTVFSTSNDNFKLIFEAIYAKLNSIPYFKKEQEKDTRKLQNRALAIQEALVKSDSLQKVYKKVLEIPLSAEGKAQTSITFEASEDNNKTKEYELYRSDITLREQLVAINRELENQQNIIEELSITPSKGFIDTSKEVMGIELNLKIFYSLLFILLSSLLLLAISFLKFLKKYNNDL